MLRLYTPIKHDIFTLHNLLEKVVCDVWCTADNIPCDDKLEQEFKDIYHYTYNGSQLKVEIERIYDIFKGLTQEVRTEIRNAFITNNDIESLCYGTNPVYLSALPDVVKSDIKPLFKWCYETLLENKLVAGDKMEYYSELIKHNDFDVCPCCGLIDIESAESICREDYDHYLPKAHYPFASVNFLNLVPICKKCNQDRKKAKDPIENDRKAFYPFSTDEHSIKINLNYTADINKKNKDLNFTGFKVNLVGQTDKIDTWDWLFKIKTRYKDKTKIFSKSFLKKIKRRHERFQKNDSTWTYSDTLNELIEDYEFDYYDDKKFLKIAFLKAIKNDVAFINVYE